MIVKGGKGLTFGELSFGERFRFAKKGDDDGPCTKVDGGAIEKDAAWIRDDGSILDYGAPHAWHRAPVTRLPATPQQTLGDVEPGQVFEQHGAKFISDPRGWVSDGSSRPAVCFVPSADVQMGSLKWCNSCTENEPVTIYPKAVLLLEGEG